MTRNDLIELLKDSGTADMPVVIYLGHAKFTCVASAEPSKKFVTSGKYSDQGRATDSLVEVIQLNLKEVR
jgi:hypothetical protein